MGLISWLKEKLSKKDHEVFEPKLNPKKFAKLNILTPKQRKMRRLAEVAEQSRKSQWRMV